MTDRAKARITKMKVDLNLTEDEEKNWLACVAMQDLSKKRADRRITIRDALATQHSTFDPRYPVTTAPEGHVLLARESSP
jgi:hypothetical protein